MAKHDKNNKNNKSNAGTYVLIVFAIIAIAASVQSFYHSFFKQYSVNDHLLNSSQKKYLCFL